MSYMRTWLSSNGAQQKCDRSKRQRRAGALGRTWGGSVHLVDCVATRVKLPVEHHIYFRAGAGFPPPVFLLTGFLTRRFYSGVLTGFTQRGESYSGVQWGLWGGRLP